MKIFVGCSSSDDIDKSYFDDNKELLDELFKNHDLVFGACNRGLMGVAYNAALNNKRNITGICPRVYKDDFNTLKCDKEIIVDSTLERLEAVFKESDIMLFLPGGIGTYSELFSAIESRRSGEFESPIILYNSNGFFDKFNEMMSLNHGENFSKQDDFTNYIVFNSKQEIINACNSYVKPDYKKSYERGLYLIKDSLSELQPPFTEINKYYDYPIGLIEKEVENAQKNGTDTNEFYKEQCDKLLELYNKLLMTILITQSQVGSGEQKRRAERVLLALRGQDKEKSSKLSLKLFGKKNNSN